MLCTSCFLGMQITSGYRLEVVTVRKLEFETDAFAFADKVRNIRRRTVRACCMYVLPPPPLRFLLQRRLAGVWGCMGLCGAEQEQLHTLDQMAHVSPHAIWTALVMRLHNPCGGRGRGWQVATGGGGRT